MAKPPKFKPNGEPDLRGHGEGSKGTQFKDNDGRQRPGRTKGVKDDKTEVLLIRDMMIEAVIGGRKRKVTTRFGIKLKMREKALKGDHRAAEWLDSRFAKYEPIDVEPDLTRALLDDDLEILRDAAERGVMLPEPLRPPDLSKLLDERPAVTPGEPEERS